MDLGDLEKIMDRARLSAFRLETLPQYLVPQEEKEFAAWRSGQPWPRRTPENSEWLKELRQIVARGIRWYRVHIVDHPLSDYTRFELRGYLENQDVGEEINIAVRHEHPELTEMHEDFWLIDDEVAVRMVYDDDGHFLHPDATEDVTPYLSIRETAMRCAESLDDYVKRTQPRLAI